ncbi:MAG: flagellar hook-associated protein FlgK [Kofleriaceae bacterium]|jgi:flagellar hook-associated protein 1 FlgK|nr:flagellar hook-associated protein FlgK [Kofleriaceae bacterium]MBP9204767.1 flagellar hook-associated protein FlgK [Kofleriaceae bacterium]
MSNLLSLLGLGASGIAAQNAGVSVAANNVANVNTEGYSRERVDLRAEPMTNRVLPGGVRAEATQRYANEMLSGRMRTASGALGMSSAFHRAMLDLEHLVASAGPGIEQSLAALSSKLGEVAAAPLDRNLRDAAVAAAGDLAANIRRRAESIDASQDDADARIIANTSVANTLTGQLAEANRSLAMTDDPTLRDRRDQLATQLADLVGGRARIDPDGHMRFVLDGGAVLVDGVHAASLSTSADPVTGFAQVEVVSGNQRRDVTRELRAGQVGGDLAFRDDASTAAAASLDALAFDVSTAYNNVHRTGAGLDGGTGRDLFVPAAGPTGAALAFEVDPTVAADSDLLASAAVGAGVGDNSGALALNQVAGQRVATGGTRTLTDAAIDLSAGVGRIAADATAAYERDRTVGTHLAGLRDAFAGVDLDEEMTQLARFQHAAEAMTRVVSTVDQLLGDMIARL